VLLRRTSGMMNVSEGRSRGRSETFNVARRNLINSRRLGDRNRRKSHLDQTWESDIKIARYHSPTDFYLWDCVKEIACRISL